MSSETPMEEGLSSSVDTRKQTELNRKEGSAFVENRFRIVRFLRSSASLFCVILLLALVALSLTGCGSGFGLGGSLGISGGGFPIGGSRLTGKAVSAMDTSKAIPNTNITVEATPPGGVTQTYQMQTDSKGAFSLDGVLAGKPGGTVILTATPPDSTFKQQRISFQITAGRPDQVLMTLSPFSLDQSIVKSLTIALSSSAIASGSTSLLNVVLKDANGVTVNFTPSLLFEGDFGTLNDDGSFTVNKDITSGSGKITAYWFGLTPQSVDVRVDNNVQVQPPPLPLTPVSKKSRSVKTLPDVKEILFLGNQ